MSASRRGTRVMRQYSIPPHHGTYIDASLRAMACLLASIIPYHAASIALLDKYGNSIVTYSALPWAADGWLACVPTKYLDVLCSQRLHPSDIHHQPACVQDMGTSTLAWHCTVVSLASRTHRCIPSSNAFGSIEAGALFRCDVVLSATVYAINAPPSQCTQQLGLCNGTMQDV
ncbi:hypothetical protein LY76DRAFT_292425 [Colletotrichum caudatum]|nr:hypothetical protein LY76DRAFT_292425 [Colletotrichum caudatum]